LKQSAAAVVVALLQQRHNPVVSVQVAAAVVGRWLLAHQAAQN
jgi:phosphatidylserine decarboxylase